MVHPCLLGRASCLLSADGGPARAVDVEGRHVGNAAGADRGRRTGKERRAIVGYFEDGPNLVTMAMNGWMEPEPAWWLNLQARPDATVELKSGSRAVRGRAAIGEERERLWARWRESGEDVDGYAARRPAETAVMILEPREN